MRNSIALCSLLAMAGCFDLFGSLSSARTFVGPCGGSATNALLFDSSGIGWIGCGENADGAGLYTSQDNGASWSEVYGWEEVRVSDIREGPDGELLLAGKDTLDSGIAFEIAPDGTESVLLDYGPSSPFMRIGHAENILVTRSGEALVDSLTGVYVGWRPDADASWQEWYYFDDQLLEDGTERVAPIRQLALLGDRWVAVGGAISDPPQVFLPSTHPDATVHVTTLEVDTTNGELYDVEVLSDLDASGNAEIIAGGWDQTDRDLMMFRCSGDPWNPASWTRITLANPFEGAVFALASDAERVVAVGERFPSSAGGFVLESRDGGVTWSDITPDGASSLSEVAFLPNGQLYVAGSGSYAARL